jgi:hypothetical protein
MPTGFGQNGVQLSTKAQPFDGVRDGVAARLSDAISVPNQYR